MRKKLLIMLFAGVLSLLMASAAFAAHPAGMGDSVRKNGGAGFTSAYSTGCAACHESSAKGSTGPHGGYTASTNKCQTCHDVHDNQGNAILLGGLTLTQACNFCHDLTGTSAGPFNTTGAMDVKSAHRVSDINFGSYKNAAGGGIINEGKVDQVVYEDKAEITVIPGGDQWTLGDGYLNAANQGQLSGTTYFTCDSCHTPHGVNTVKPYLGESGVKDSTSGLPAGATLKIYQTNRLLKSKPTVLTTTAIDNYGSKWCLACHAGRDNTFMGIDDRHNHPVDETLDGYLFLKFSDEEGEFHPGKSPVTVKDNAYVLIGSDPAVADLTVDPRSNKQYSMTATDWNTKAARPDGYTPIANYGYLPSDEITMPDTGPSCQQCHGSARDIESAFAVNTNPERMSFPHISANKALLVETGDDFCTNCHDPQILP